MFVPANLVMIIIQAPVSNKNIPLFIPLARYKIWRRRKNLKKAATTVKYD